MLKRSLDLVLGTVLAAGVALLLPMLALLAWVSIGSPILFRQRRIGLGGREFDILKIRTMTNERDAGGQLLPDAQRLTRIGALLRRFRLDELPCVINIFRGELSLVGPRPLPRQGTGDAALWTLRQSVKPGFTGLAQVSGNTLLAETEKLALDIYYISNQSTLTDIAILAKTLWTVIRGEKRNEGLIRVAMGQLLSSERNLH